MSLADLSNPSVSPSPAILLCGGVRHSSAHALSDVSGQHCRVQQAGQETAGPALLQDSQTNPGMFSRVSQPLPPYPARR